MKDNNTQYFKVINDSENRVTNTLIEVYESLIHKGYNPVNQMVGYIMSGDPTYITGYNNSRSKIAQINRDDIVEELVKAFVEYHQLNDKESR